SMINPIGLGRFSMLETLSMRNDLKEGASRPFDRLRDGMVLGEGSAAIVMESLENAQRRKAHIYAEVVGYGSSLDAYRIPISSSKSMLGHTIAAAGAIEFVATVMSVKSGIIPPTINLINPDPMCDLDYVPLIARKADVKIALSNSFGFGGQNSTLICRKIK
ncbi:MAG: 3-oxoacyl-[acyl-carrier-protein] synthase, partial [Candidatus Poribacteria bacterium]|nr:3-oxoacyl-[acyl-carrier-protein] synthase [Candidatus Poribacteria bacterium]